MVNLGTQSGKVIIKVARTANTPPVYIPVFTQFSNFQGLYGLGFRALTRLLTACQIRYHSQFSDHHSTGQLRTLLPRETLSRVPYDEQGTPAHLGLDQNKRKCPYQSTPNGPRLIHPAPLAACMQEWNAVMHGMYRARREHETSPSALDLAPEYSMDLRTRTRTGRGGCTTTLKALLLQRRSFFHVLRGCKSKHRP